ncbi:unnamed protein product, partial [Thelazia callipaeda]|uniref:DDE Tnp4 domain-containing protein n=1 Tax=Thelazia callipaeda TaxID=103827 RepID=A0A0N5CTX6_THECL
MSLPAFDHSSQVTVQMRCYIDAQIRVIKNKFHHLARVHKRKLRQAVVQLNHCEILLYLLLRVSGVACSSSYPLITFAFCLQYLTALFHTTHGYKMDVTAVSPWNARQFDLILRNYACRPITCNFVVAQLENLIGFRSHATTASDIVDGRMLQRELKFKKIGSYWNMDGYCIT